MTTCPNDTDHDGDCHLCHKLPHGCFLRDALDNSIHCAAVSKTQFLLAGGSLEPLTSFASARRFLVVDTITG